MPPSPVRLQRLFLDANVLFAACRQEGRARALSPPPTPWRARRNLEAKRPEAPMALVRKAPAEGLPLKDAPIPAAWGAGAEALVAGDRRRFGPLMGREVRGSGRFRRRRPWRG